MSIAECSNQSDLQWRKRKRYNGDDVMAQKQGRQLLPSPLFITLAKESPSRLSAPEDSEDAMYDSDLHGRETEVCRDTSDTESYMTDTIATMEVLEYEVASDSSVSETVFSDDSSSGTDGLAAAAVGIAHHFFGGGRKSSMRGLNSDIFADTEESDAPTDPELGRADYWTCVKCKNRQNNPMYRYCEKCYQIRKTHFPPRPQFRKTRNSATPNHSSLTTRSNLGSASPSTYGSSSPSTNGSSSSSSDDEKDQHRQQRRRPPRRVHQEAGSVVRSTNSGSSSLGIATDPDNCASPPSKRHYDGKLTNTNNHPIVTVRRKGIVNTIGRNVAKPVAAHSAGESSVASEDIEPASVLEVVTTPQSSTSSGSIPSTVNIKLQNKFFKNVIDTMPQGKIKPPTQLTIPARSLLDSGHGSCSSSLELSPDMPTCSQETFCSDIEDTIGGETVDAQTTSAVQSSYSQCSTLSLASSYETIGLTADIRSLSSSSERLPDSFDINVAEVQSRQTAVKAKRRPYSDVDAANSDDETSKPLRKMKHIENRNLSSNDQKLPLGALAMASLSSPSALGGHSIELGSEDSTYGSCMMCLTQPKNGVFVHNRFLHLCCCYRCAVKVWNKRKRCPICNCKVKNVMKLFVH